MQFKKFENALTEYEKTELVPLIRSALISRYNKGLRSEYSASQMCESLRSKLALKISTSRLRKIMHYLALSGLNTNLVICANTKGYFLTNDPAIIKKYMKSLHSRISSQLAKYKAIESDLARMEDRKQMKLTDEFFAVNQEP